MRVNRPKFIFFIRIKKMNLPSGETNIFAPRAEAARTAT